MNNLMNNPMQLMNRLNQFRQTLQGDPQQQVMNLLRSGKINQQQLNQAQQMATQIQNFMRGVGTK